MFWRRRQLREHDLERELRSHLELEAQEQEQQGLSEGEARYGARRALGNPTSIKEEVREMWGWTFVGQLGQDFRYAIRTIRANRAFSAAAILSLALGIGANTAIFSLIDALLLRTLPVPNPTGLVQLKLVVQGLASDLFAYPVIRALQERAEIFSGVGGFSSSAFINVASRDGSERVAGAWVTGDFYSTLGLEPFAGRLLTKNDDEPGSPPVAVLSYSYWENRFGRDFGAVGRSIRIEGKPVTIVGITPKGFAGANVGEAANLTLSAAAMAQLFPERVGALQAGSQWLRVLARPRADISIVQAKARLGVVWPRVASNLVTPSMPSKRRLALLSSSIDLVPGATGVSRLREQYLGPLRILMAITGLVLLIASANFANLLLARGKARSKEIALRFAIGASRSRILRQLLTESVILSTIGAVLGIGLAGVGSRLLIALLSSGRRDAVLLDVQPDARVLLFTSAVALITGIVFGLVPALRATATAPGTVVKSGSGAESRSRSRLLPTLVATQVALSLVLLVGAGLFVRTLQNLERLDPGFRRQGVLLINVDPRRAGYKDTRLTALYEDLLQRFEHLPGVVSASLSSNTPLSGSTWTDPVSINSQPAPKSDPVYLSLVAPRYFETMGTPLVLGREFSTGDRPGAPGAAIVNESFARQFLEGRPLGQRISVANPRFRFFEVVGVVKDTLSRSLRESAPPSVYMPAAQYPEMIGAAYFELRVEGSLVGTAALVRDELHARFPAMPAEVQVEPLSEQVGRTLNQERLLAALGTCFGSLALVLAAVGLYGLLAYTVARSTREIGIRIALGAKRGEVVGWVLMRALRLVAGGIAIGMPIAWASTRLVGSVLFGLRATDPVTALMALALLTATALAAAFIPALRAARVDPVVALRYE